MRGLFRIYRFTTDSPLDAVLLPYFQEAMWEWYLRPQPQ